MVGFVGDEVDFAQKPVGGEVLDSFWLEGGRDDSLFLVVFEFANHLPVFWWGKGRTFDEQMECFDI